MQFQLTDAEVERVGLEELAKYALWSIETRRPEALDDALALRAAALEAAEIVFRVAHQLHGAIGFCDETTLSWVSRASVPLRRLPFGLSATRARLLRSIGRHGLTRSLEPGRVVNTTVVDDYPHELFDLDGKTAVVTGTSAGIGTRLARTLVLAGARVAAIARRRTELDEAATSTGRLLSDDGRPC